MDRQRTLAERVTCTGLGLHTGEPVELTLSPARVHAGLRFVRRMGSTECEIPANFDSVCATDHATTLGNGTVRISTVEHVLAALYAMGIHNATIAVDGPEVPVMDGSAAPFVHLIRSAGVYEQLEPQPMMRIERKIEVCEGSSSISIEPARHFQISCRIDFAHPAIGVQEISIDRVGPTSFEHEVARARTFGFLDEVEALRRAGLGLGGALGNTVVLNDAGVMNPGGLRYADEFVRHKVLDLIGDLALLGVPLQGHVRVNRGGHALHHALVMEIQRQPRAWRIVRGKSPGRNARARSPIEVSGH